METWTTSCGGLVQFWPMPTCSSFKRHTEIAWATSHRALGCDCWLLGWGYTLSGVVLRALLLASLIEGTAQKPAAVGFAKVLISVPKFVEVNLCRKSLKGRRSASHELVETPKVGLHTHTSGDQFPFCPFGTRWEHLAPAWLT